MNNSKLFAALSYFTWIGFLITFLFRDKNDSLVRRHLNQALVINIISTLASFLIKLGSIFGYVGGIINLACFILFVVGFIRALKGSDEPLPIVGNYTLIS